MRILIPKPALVTGLLLVVAALAFAGLAFQQVPMGTTQTLPQTSTQIAVSYTAYPVLNIASYTTTGLPPYYTGWQEVCFGETVAPPYVTCATFANTVKCDYVACNVVTQTTYSMDGEVQSTATFPYTQTLTGSITESSTSLVPASTSFGLSRDSFTLLAVVVIGILFLLTLWVALKPRSTDRPKQATMTRFVNRSNFLHQVRC